MENAAKALLMAGGILFAILVLSLLVVLFNNMNTISESQQKNEDVEELKRWNEEWESYNKQAMYGTDVISLVNKAAENNHLYADNPQYMIEIKVEGIDINTELYNHKTSIFKCIGVTYNDETGRVNSMTFKFIR